jgi:hypothetical protein
MNTNELNLRLWSNSVTRIYYGGCYAADKLPRPYQIPQAFVVNEDDSSSPGTHWVAVFCRSMTRVDYFDSFAMPPMPKISEWLTQFPVVNRNLNSYQSKTSDVCGFYTLFFVYMCSMGYSMAQIEKILSGQENPDHFVVGFVNRNM